jgi:hypothetical protein
MPTINYRIVMAPPPCYRGQTRLLAREADGEAEHQKYIGESLLRPARGCLVPAGEHQIASAFLAATFRYDSGLDHGPTVRL